MFFILMSYDLAPDKPKGFFFVIQSFLVFFHTKTQQLQIT